MPCPAENTWFDYVGGNLDSHAIGELDAHLDSCPSCRVLFAALVNHGQADTAVARPIAWGDATLFEIAPGTAVGRYIVLATIGRGGMGVVYKAFDPELDRAIALKLVHFDSLDPARSEPLRQRLLREAKTLAQLSHPNVVTVHDVGTYDGDLFVAMELVAGQTLRGWLNSEQRTPREIMSVFAAAGAGLAAAHAAGIVHRDFKPENVMVGDDGRVRVLDFGLARTYDATLPLAEGSSTDVTARLTLDGTVMGTPAYMAPEQDTGKEVDARSDQFSFCAALFEALFERPAFTGNSYRELANSRAAGGVIAPARRGVSASVRAALAKGLRPEPADRHPAMGNLLAELGRRPSLTGRHAVAAIVAMTALASALVVGLAWPRSTPASSCMTSVRARLDTVWNAGHKEAVRRALVTDATPATALRWQHVERALDRYADAWESASGARCTLTPDGADRSEQARAECLDERLAELATTVDILAHADSVVAGHAIETAESIASPASCATRATAALSRDPATRGRVAAVREAAGRAIVLARAGRRSEALAQLQPLEQQAEQLADRSLVAQLQLTIAKLRRTIDGPDAAATEYRSAALNAEAGRHDEVAAEAWIAVMKLAADSGSDLATARDAGDHANAALDRIGRPPDLDGLYWLGRGDIAWHIESDAKHALELYGRGKAILERDAPKEVFRALGSIAEVYEATGEPELALANRQQALDFGIRELGADHPMLAGLYGGVAQALSYLGRYDEAVAMGERNVSLREIADGSASYELAMALYNLGQMYVGAGEVRPALDDKAVATFKRAHEIARTAVGADDPLTLRIEVKLGDAYAAQGRLDDAAATFAAVMPRLEGAKVGDKSLARARGDYAMVLGERRQFQESYHQARLACEFEERLAAGKATVELAQCVGLIAEDAIGLGRRTEAVNAATRARDLARAAKAPAPILADADNLLARAERAH
jgi:tetratricopeptide (TPR) repeat protein